MPFSVVYPQECYETEETGDDVSLTPPQPAHIRSRPPTPAHIQMVEGDNTPQSKPYTPTYMYRSVLMHPVEGAPPVLYHDKKTALPNQPPTTQKQKEKTKNKKQKRTNYTTVCCSGTSSCDLRLYYMTLVALFIFCVLVFVLMKLWTANTCEDQQAYLSVLTLVLGMVIPDITKLVARRLNNGSMFPQSGSSTPTSPT